MSKEVKLTYTLHTIPLTEREFQFYFTKHSKFIKNDWSADLDDYETYKNNPEYKELAKEKKAINKKINNYKELARRNNK